MKTKHASFWTKPAAQCAQGYSAWLALVWLVILTADCLRLSAAEPTHGIIKTNIAHLRGLVEPASLQPPSSSQLYEIEATVTTHVNLTSSGNTFFYCQDDAAGIAVFVNGKSGSEVPPAGAKVRVIGSVGHFNGLLQMNLSVTDTNHSLSVISIGNPLPPPTSLNFAWPRGFSAADDANVLEAEANEAKLVIASNVLIDPSTGPTFTSGSNVTITDATDPAKTFTLRIDSRVLDIIGQQKPSGPVTIVGVLNQFDSSAPRAGGYQLLVSRFNDISTGPFPPRITTQPESRSASRGGIANFAVEAAGTLPVTYLWSKDGVALSGATNATLSLTNLQPVSIGDYRVVVANALGSVTSSVAALNLTGVAPGLWKGLVAYYPFSGDAHDATVFANHGTVTSPTLTEDRFGAVGSAYNFKADVNSRITAPDAPQLQLGPTFTVASWVRFRETWTYHVEDLVYKAAGTFPDLNGWLLGMVEDQGYRQFFQVFKPSSFLGAETPSQSFATAWLNQWRHVVGSHSNGVVRIYVDGVLSATQAVPLASYDSAAPLVIGGSVHPVSGAYNRDLDDVRLYNRALTGREVRSLYHQEAFLPGTRGFAGWTENNAGTVVGALIQENGGQKAVAFAAEDQHPRSEIEAGQLVVELESIYNFVAVWIFNQPTNQSTATGSTVSFAVGAANLEASKKLTYQWTKDGNPLPGATNATLILTNVQPVHIGDYRVVVGNSAGAVTSSGAMLNLTGVDAGIWKGLVAFYPFNGNAFDESGGRRDFTSTPAFRNDRFGSANAASRFTTVAPIETQPVSIPGEAFTVASWLYLESAPSVHGERFLLHGSYNAGDPNITDPNAASLSFAVWQGGRVGVSILNNSFSRSHIDLPDGTVSIGSWSHIALTSVGGETKVCINGVVKGTAVGTVISRALPLRIGGESGYYFQSGSVDDLRLYNRALSEAEIAALYASEMPQPVGITAQPQGVTANVGQTVSFTVGATNALAYQWTKDGNPLTGATNATLTLTNVQPVHIGDYRVVVGNAAGSVSSSVAALNIEGVDVGVWKGLVAYYRFNGNANDESVNANDGVILRGGFIADRFGNESAAFQNPPPVPAWGWSIDTTVENQNGSSYTLAAWFKHIPQSGSIIIAYGDSGYVDPYIAVVPELIDYRLSPGNNLSYSTANISDEKWHHFVATFGAGGARLYFDGDLVTLKTEGRPTSISGHTWKLGPGVCSFDDVRIYNRALSDAEVAALYAFESTPPIPTVAAAPTNTTLLVGQTLTLNAQIAGFAPISYRWQKDESDLANGGRVSGADSQTLTVSGLTLADAGQYRLTATNANGSAVTAAATVTVHAPAAITAQPESVDGIEADPVTLAVGFSGFPAPAFQWFKNDGAIPGATGATLEFPALVETNAGSYRVVVGNVAGSVTSSNAVVTYTPAIRVLVNGAPVSGTVRTLNPVTVELLFAKPDWFLFYTLDGTEPDFASNAYLAPFTLAQPGDLRVVAYAPDFGRSVAGRAVAFRFLSPQTISWGTLPALRFGDSGPLTVSASSGLPVGVSVVNGPATLAGGVLTATGAGTVTLRAVQAGNDQFAPVSEERTLVIGPAVQTLTWPTLAAKTFGDAAFGVTVSAGSGLPVTLSVAAGKATVNGTNVTLTGAGPVTLRAEQAGNANFAAVSEERSFVVAKAAQTLTFPTIANRAYTPDPFTPVVVTGSGLPAALEVLSGPATAAGGQLTLTGVGTVIVRATQPGNDDWEAALPSDRTFTVTPGTQTLTFTPVGAKTFGDAPVTLAATSSVGLPVTFRLLSGPGTVTDATLTLTGAGSVVVQALQSGTDRYQAASASQTVVVAKAAQGLSWAAIPDQGYATNALGLNATATSGLPVSYRIVSGAATVTGAELRLTGIGAIAVAADQPGNTNWLAAASVTNTFTVSRGTQTLTFAPIGDQILGNPPVTLVATASSGLPVAFQVLTGPATVTGNQLTLLNEGSVTVRARQVGSPLWLAAQADQTFVIRKLTTLTLSPVTGGSLTVEPVKERYEPAESVTVTAVPAAGYEFGGWTGDLAGTANPTTLVMSANRTVGANFTDVAAPVLTWDLPVAGETGNEQVVLAGRVTDNAPGVTATWSRGGGPGQSLTLAADGTFRVESLILGVGTNRFVLNARDVAGNTATLERTVVWVPERVLQVGSAPEVQEGQRLVFPVRLTAHAPNVAGLTFRLSYDPTYLTDPQVEWGALVGQSVNNLNLGTPGEIGGSFALAGTALPAGTNAVATVSFRARSVPVRLGAELQPTIESLSDASGAVLARGNATVAGSGFIKPRRLTGDNNANQRLDVGDAVVISRLQVGLEERRSWDVGLNDLNTSGALDSGDVVKVLRAVVGLDPQPTPSGGVARAGVARQANNTNDVVTLEFPDGPVAALGQPWRVVVKLLKSAQPPSGLSFTLRYPAGLTLGEKQVGALIPAGALPLWGEVPGGLTFAAVSANAWPADKGVAAVVTFTANAGLATQAEWPLTLAPVELTVNGFDIRALDDVAGVVRSATVPAEPPVIALPPPGADGQLTLEVTAGADQEVIVETTTDLNAWTEAQRVTGQGSGTPVKVTITPQTGVEARFWRVRRP